LEKKYILNQEAANQKLHRMALELAENLSGSSAALILVGVKDSGLVIAYKIAALVRPYIKNEIKIISVTLNKDMPNEVILSENINLNDLNVVLIDDVANSGKTLLYGLKPFLDYYPRTVQTMVMVERMHKLYPVKPDYVGLSVATTLEDHIQLEVTNDEVIGAYITHR
jgi:pyrimidine operon attenuation protein/uracil phosphoribosyltransferase